MYDFGGEALLYAKWPNTDVSREKQSKTWVEHWGEKKIKHRLMDCYLLLGKCWVESFTFSTATGNGKGALYW